MPSDSPLVIDKVFLDVCRQVSLRMSPTFPAFHTPLLITLSPTPYSFAELNNGVPLSDFEGLSAFYARASYDFYGTPSRAQCVYKNGDAWPVDSGFGSWPIIREARGVHDHPMQAAWPELGKRVYTLLDDKNVRWTSIDPLAFAEEGRRIFSPLLIWIGVEPKSLTYELANTAAEAINFLLTEAGFSGFEIGFRESIVTRSVAHCVTGPKMLPFDPFNDSIPEFCKPFTPTLGLSIAPFDSPYFEGTGALYLRESKDSQRVLLLTCGHVVRPPSKHSGNTVLAGKDRRRPRDKVIALGSSGYVSALRSMMAVIGELDSLVSYQQDLLDQLGGPEEGEPKHTTEKRDEYLSLTRKARKRINEIYKFHDEASKHWSTPDQRIIGEVLHVAPIATNVPPDVPPPVEFTRDWALVELYNDKFDWDTFLGNKVYVGGNLSFLDYSRLMYPSWPEDKPNCEYLLDSLLQVSGIIQTDEIHNPQHLDANREQCLFVVKNGLTTGTTIGRVMGMESFTRIYNEYGIKETSMEIGVLPYNTKNGPFSAPGDSGSIVLDKNGRILGMLTGGAGAAYETDISYVTPYWWLEKEIKKHFPDCVLYETVK